MSKLPWSERVNMLSINPHAATIEDIAKLAADTSENAALRADKRRLSDTVAAQVAEMAKRIGEETTCCIYCGEQFSWKEPVENITKHIEDCDKHPLKYWIGQAELYKSEFLARDIVWKKAEARVKELESCVYPKDHEPYQSMGWEQNLFDRKRVVVDGDEGQLTIATCDSEETAAKICHLQALLVEKGQQVANIEEYMLKGVAFRDQLQSRVEVLEKVVEAANQYLAYTVGRAPKDPNIERKRENELRAALDALEEG